MIQYHQSRQLPFTVQTCLAEYKEDNRTCHLSSGTFEKCRCKLLQCTHAHTRAYTCVYIYTHHKYTHAHTPHTTHTQHTHNTHNTHTHTHTHTTHTHTHTADSILSYIRMSGTALCDKDTSGWGSFKPNSLHVALNYTTRKQANLTTTWEYLVGKSNFCSDFISFSSFIVCGLLSLSNHQSTVCQLEELDLRYQVVFLVAQLKKC